MPGPKHATHGDRLLPLWFAFLGPPLIWAARFAANYALVPWSCERGSVLLLQVITLAALIGVAWAGFIAWRAWRAVGKIGQGDSSRSEAGTRFMALAGLISSAIFFSVIAAEAMGLFLIDPCQGGGTLL